jgi:chromosomal replication initiator protein
MDAQQLWRTARGQLQLQLTRPTFETWIKNTQAISYEDGVLVVAVHSAYAKDWLENRLYKEIHAATSDIANRTVKVRFVVGRNSHDTSSEQHLLNEDLSESDDAGLFRPAGRDEARLNPKYGFDSFIIGQSNRLAHAACLAVAEEPGQAYNPLFVYGGVGLGKTHLLHAIGNHVLAMGKRVLYVPAETFANEMINAIRRRTTDDFRAKYRTIDVLLLDDTQFLIGKERTQEEFFHTFNNLYQDSRQIVLSSDRSPKAFVGLEERLRSRFGWGLTADIQPPDLEMRVAILQAKAEARSVLVPNEVLQFIAESVESNIRELEGALTRVLAVARMLGLPMSIQTAEKALGEMVHAPAKVTMEHILSQVASHFGLRVDDLIGPRRPRAIARPRQIAMFLARELTDMSLPRIGQALGGRDHTTVMHGCDKIGALFEKDEEIRRHVLDLKTQLASGRRTAIGEPGRVLETAN